MSVAPFAHPMPTGRAFWQESRNAGTSYNAAPAPISTTQVAGPTGQQRYRTLFTIPAGLGGTFTVTASGDIYDGDVNQNAHLFYDGVDQGAVTPLPGPRTFTLPVVPGAHDLQLRIGSANDNAGATVPNVSFNFDRVTVAAGTPDPGGCCCPVLDTVRCYRVVTTGAFHRAYLANCDGVFVWRDVVTGLEVDPADIDDCNVDPTIILPDFTGTTLFFGDGPDPAGENLCNIVPTPSGFTGFTSVLGGLCLDPVNGPNTVTWTDAAGVEFEYGRAGTTSGGAALVFSSTELGTVTWPNTGQLNPGAQVMSNPLLSGRRVLLTYVSGPLGSSPSGSVRIISGNQVFVHQLSTSNTAPPIRIRLDFLAPPRA